MNAEQLKELKKDDEIFIRARYERLLNCGDVSFSHSSTESRGREVSAYGYTHPSNVILPSELQPAEKPKYDPCRLFKKGDKVRIVRRNNRHFNLETCRCHNKIATVDCNEKDLNPDTPLRLEVEGEYVYSDAAYLELITPVEELERYGIAENLHGWIVYKDNPGNVVANFNNIHPHAKEAAEAECARLNAEHRKEQPRGNQ